MIKTESQPITLKEKIKECMISHDELGGRYVLEIDLEDAEEIMYLATGDYHNSICPEIRTITEDGKEIQIPCGKNVSCVCTANDISCNHIWYCPDHILKHNHRKTLKKTIMEIKIEQ